MEKETNSGRVTLPPGDPSTLVSMMKALYHIGAVRFGDFVLKSGASSRFYLDLRLLVSYPILLAQVADCLWERVKGLSFDYVCGVPYTALPFATALSLAHQIPMVIRRKERKAYGRKRSVEGAFRAGARCLVLEDLVTSGSSVEETIADLQAEGLRVTDVAVLLDREEGGRARLEASGYTLHALFTLSQLFTTLGSAGFLTEEEEKIVAEVVGVSV